jgi:uncharacterized phage-like protein YoqJ
MDFLDPQKQKAHARRLTIGYLLIGCAVILATTILLYRSYGFELGKNGQIVQQGLVFVSSSPNPANIYLDGHLDGTTNKRIFLDAGQYTIKLQRDGYRPWVRAVTVEGGSVEHFDYPFLFPTTLTSSSVKNYGTAPALSIQSPSRQWLLVQSPAAFNKFDEFNLNQKQASQVISNESSITVPSSVLTPSTGTQSWSLEEWSTDNTHVILKHNFEEDGEAASEYILLDRANPQDSINLTNTLGTNPTFLDFVNKSNYQDYYVYNQSAGTLDTASLSAPAPQPYLKDVLNFYPYNQGLILYATTQKAAPGKAWINLLQNGTTYPITQLATIASAQYLLNFTQYNGDWYVAAGVSGDNKVYVYEDPQAQLQAEPNQALAPVAILKVNDPSTLTFSSNAQFIMAEGGTSFAVYDAQNEKSYAYNTDAPLDSPQQSATWMDGDRLMYVSNGKVVVFDYDSSNEQTLVSALPDLVPVFDQNYRFLYTYMSTPTTGSTPAGVSLEATPLLIPKDQ